MVTVPAELKWYKSMPTVIDRTNEVIHKARTGEDPPLLYRWRKFNDKLGGIYHDDLITIAARPGVGKSALSGIIVRDILEINSHLPLIGTYDSFEMPDYQLALRWYSEDHRIETKRIRSYLNPISDEQFDEIKVTGEALKRLPLLIRDRPVTPEQWFKDGERLMELYPQHRVVRFFDHTRLSLAKSNYQSEEQKITELMDAANQLKNRGTASIILSQMNRDIEKEKNRSSMGSSPPVLADIFGASSVEQYSTCVIALHRPAMYGCKEYVIGNVVFNTENFLAAHVLKQREGWTGMISLKEELQYYRITDGNEVRYDENGRAVIKFN
jgi:replicative DNA helicase